MKTTITYSNTIPKSKAKSWMFAGSKMTILGLAALTLLSSCGYEQKIWWENHITDEFKTVGPAPERSPNLQTSDNPADYIHRGGQSGIAIPAKKAFDFYISPFAPNSGYIRSKLPPGSKIICPYSKKVLYLGDRYLIEEKEL